MKHLFSPILFAALTACTIVRPIPHEPLPVSPPPPTETEQHLQQLNALNAEVSSLKKQLNSLQTRVQQLERSATPSAPARSRTTPPTKKTPPKKHLKNKSLLLHLLPAKLPPQPHRLPIPRSTPRGNNIVQATTQPY